MCGRNGGGAAHSSVWPKTRKPTPLPTQHTATPDATLNDALAAFAAAAASVPGAAIGAGATARARVALARGGAPLDGRSRCVDLAPGADVFVVAEADGKQRGDDESSDGDIEEVSTAVAPPPTTDDGAAAASRADALAAAGDRATAMRLLAACPGHVAAAAAVWVLLAAGRVGTAVAAAAEAARDHPTSYPCLLAAADAAAAAVKTIGDPSTDPDAPARYGTVLDAYSAAADAAVAGGDAGLDARAAAALLALRAGGLLADSVAPQLAQVVLDVDDGHATALAVYAGVAAARSLPCDAVRAAVRVLPRARRAPPGSRDAVAFTLASSVLADLAATEAGHAAIVAELGALGDDAARSAAVWSLLGGAVARAGEPAAAARLLARAAGEEPGDADIARARAQALEAAGDAEGALGVVAAWCARAGADTQTPLRAALAAATTNLPPLDSSTAWLVADGWPDGEAGGGGVQAGAGDDDAGAAALTAITVRVLFANGALSRATALLAALPDGSLTSRPALRNEAAYVELVRRVLHDDAPAAPRATGTEPPLFVVGDSHAMVPAWRVVTVGDTRRVVVPLLAPGATLWCARANAPRARRVAAWRAALARVPADQDVILACVGGLDATEYLPRSVASLRYESVAAAAAATADAGVAGLAAAAEAAGTLIAVHSVPVPSVSEAAAGAAGVLNSELRRAVEAHSGGGRVRWLDVASSGKDGNALLDGLHRRPEYVRDLEAALAGVV